MRTAVANAPERPPRVVYQASGAAPPRRLQVVGSDIPARGRPWGGAQGTGLGEARWEP